jgi:copper chaperone CopZ
MYMKNHTFTVEGMHCGGCARRTEQTIAELDGVSGVVVDFASKTADVTFDEVLLSEEDIIRAVDKLGYTMAIQT